MAWKEELDNNDIEDFKRIIDPPIRNLIIKMNKLPFLTTTWSCAGHGETTYCELYHRGIMFHIDRDSEEGKIFIEKLNKLIERNFSFAHLSLPFPEGGAFSSHPLYSLEVDWFSYPEMRDRDIEKRRNFLMQKLNETYHRLNASLEEFIDEFLDASMRVIKLAVA